MQWKPLNVNTMGQTGSDNINKIITRSDLVLIQLTYLTVIWDLVNLSQFDQIN
jgi:hypothetical protein